MLLCVAERYGAGNEEMVAERRTYPLLAVVLTATLVCLSVWRMSGSCPDHPYCEPEPPVPPYRLLDHYEPYDRGQLLDPADDGVLIDLRDFSYLMNDPVCNTSSSPLYVVLVHSSPDHEAHRRAIRGTWGRRAHVVFLLGETNSSAVQDALYRENDAHHDLVQGAFLDSYRNLTYKHVLGLKWITYHCPDARYVIKVDDDVFVNTPFLEEFLTRELSPAGARRLVMCDVMYDAMVKRSYRSKWHVSHHEYPDRHYPDYCMGWAILYSPDSVFRLYREAQRSDYFWIDDVHVTGTLLGKINYTLTAVGDLSVLEQRALKMLDSGRLEDFLFSLIPPAYFYEMWEFVTSSRAATLRPDS